MKPTALSAVIACTALAALFALAACGSTGKPKCGPMNCAGCCTTTNVCVSGQTSMFCGRQGAACTGCNTVQSCHSGACVENSTGGGSVGSGGGVGGGLGVGGGAIGGGVGGGGGSENCATLSMIGGTGPDIGVFTSDLTNGFDEEDAYVNGPDAGELLWISEYYGNGLIPVAPRTVQLASTTWSSCGDCVVYSFGCTQMGCDEDYLAQSGTLQIDQLTLNPDAGVFSGSIMNIHLVQWDGINNMNSDGPTVGGKCLDITTGTFNGTWP
jgi:hypothetical protein